MRKRKSIGVFSFVVMAAALVTIQTNAAPDDTKSAVTHVLLMQQDAWNRHDIDAFMTGYWNSPNLTFFSGAKQTSGWQATLDRYRSTYTSPGHEMGTLEFSELSVEALAPDAAFVRGAWHLTMAAGLTSWNRAIAGLRTVS